LVKQGLPFFCCMKKLILLCLAISGFALAQLSNVRITSEPFTYTAGTAFNVQLAADFEDGTGLDCELLPYRPIIGVKNLPAGWIVNSVTVSTNTGDNFTLLLNDLNIVLLLETSFGGAGCGSTAAYNVYYKNDANFCDGVTALTATVSITPSSTATFPAYDISFLAFGGEGALPTNADCPQNHDIPLTNRPAPMAGGDIAANQTVCLGGDPAAFTSVAAATGGTAPRSYQWQSSATLTGTYANIVGATDATYDAPVQNTVGTTYYRRRVTDNSSAQAFSDTLSITVNPLPVANAGADASTCGNSYTLSPTATNGTGSWSVVSQPMGASASFRGNTANNLTVPGTYTFRYTVSASGCTNAIDEVSITRPTEVAISTQPISQTVAAGTAVVLSVVATGSGLGYQWRKGDVNIAGATAGSYALASVSPADAGSYTVVVSGDCGSPLTSAPAVLTVQGTNARGRAGTLAGLQVYPNPVRGQLNLAVAQSGTYTVRLLSLQGQEVARSSFGGTTYQLDVAGVAAGTYLLSISGHAGDAVQRIVLE
jgi:hypothetical protein